MYKVHFRILVFKRVIGSSKVLKITSIEIFGYVVAIRCIKLVTGSHNIAFVGCMGNSNSQHFDEIKFDESPI